VRIWNGIASFTEGDDRVVASIGNYDGVHSGHQAILRRVTEDARSRDLRSLLITFDPHPAAVLAPERRLRRLQTRGQKLERLEQTGLDDLLILCFDDALAALDGNEFFDQLLGDRVRFAAIHVGENFRFGRGRVGDLELLRQIGARRGFEVDGVPTVELDGTTVSSSAIRLAVDEGRVESAARMLGRPFQLTGEIVRGAGRGQTLDCPTANLDPENEIIPARGVYVTEAEVLARSFSAVTNVGFRPTFGGDRLVVETHLLDFDDELYDERLDLLFLTRLRDEIRFEDKSALVEQIARDRDATQAYFSERRLEQS
jgi:riboflavin kinase/FMN adenylyltransferase